MKAALIVMTLMGCDDSATQCHYIDTVDRSWQTVALCDAQAETYINRHQDKNYPVIVAVCETASDRMTAEVTPTPDPAPADTTGETPLPLPAETVEARQGLAARTLSFLKKAIPDRQSLKAAVTTPIRYAEDGYSWVAKRFAD
ncbi:hypothetical protein [Shinella oryzae]|uniref:Lipoprotein n=1 Tax=Shinella oryzae TaxID=2871820 RepID=A0ABY9K199_9HYPH|nr:hypothetical protein [Shinella oryzae]WLS02352.1 hypothetical protein Q9315_13070 [Shinella oryzae]